MNIESILSEWEKDSKIDETEIAKESIKIPKLHHKYYTIFIQEKLILKKHESAYKQLKLDKYNFYTQGHNEETRKLGWQLPAIGIIRKTDVDSYLETDPDVMLIQEKINLQREKVELLDSIIKSFANRGYLLRTALDFIRFTNGL